MTNKKKRAKGGSVRGRKKGAPPAPSQSRTVLILSACLIPLLLVGFSLYAKDLTAVAWNAVAEYQSPYLFEVEPQAATSRPATGGVLLIIIDGLRVDLSRDLPTLNQLRQAGADLIAEVGQPSLSNPAAAVIPSGTTQEIHGVTTNWYEGQIRVDSLFRSAQRSGKTTGVVGGKGWIDLYADTIGEMHVFDDYALTYDDEVFEQAMAMLTGTKPLPDLLIVHFGGTDQFAHSHGGASQEYRDVALKIDGYVAEMLAAYDLDNRTVIITADHGHIDTGGHGGWEPEVLNVPLIFTGKAARQGTAVDPQKGISATTRQVDIAPTIAALLGMSMPTHTVGTILTEAVVIPDEDLAKAFINLAETRYVFSRQYFSTVARTLGPGQAISEAAVNIEDGSELAGQAWVNLVAGDPALAVITAKGSLHLSDQGREKVKDLRLKAERSSRATTAILLALLPLLALYFLVRNRWFVVAVGGAALYFIGYNVLFFLIHGYRHSLSVFNEDRLIMQFFNARMLEAALIVLAVAVLMGLVVGLRKEYDGPELAQGVAGMSYLVAYGLALQVLWFFYQNGVSFGWFVPDLRMGMKFYIDLMQVVPTGLASLAVVPLTLGVAKLTTAIGKGRAAAPPA